MKTIKIWDDSDIQLLYSVCSDLYHLLWNIKRGEKPSLYDIEKDLERLKDKLREVGGEEYNPAE